MTTAAPRRIQRKRTKGWRAPQGAVNVDRSTKWGNPFRWDDYRKWATEVCGEPLDEPIRIHDSTRRRWAAVDFENAIDPALGGTGLRGYPTVEEIRAELAGKTLMCWCPDAEPDQPQPTCHADVLLRIANTPAGA